MDKDTKYLKLLVDQFVKSVDENPNDFSIGERKIAKGASRELKNGRLVEGIRPEVLLFAVEMENKLKLNDYKGGWNNCPLPHLIERAQEELDELKEAIRLRGLYDKPPHIKIINEAADVANMVMMIADNCQKRAELLGEVEQDGQ